MSSPVWVDQGKVAQQLQAFFGAKRNDLSAFGQTVNQTFEAYVFAAMISWYKQRGWDVQLISPKNGAAGTVKLKFNTRGKPSGYTYAFCRKGSKEVQIRHGLRVAKAEGGVWRAREGHASVRESGLPDDALAFSLASDPKAGSLTSRCAGGGARAGGLGG
jgi:hypothetical protein